MCNTLYDFRLYVNTDQLRSEKINQLMRKGSAILIGGRIIETVKIKSVTKQKQSTVGKLYTYRIYITSLDSRKIVHVEPCVLELTRFLLFPQHITTVLF